MKEFKIKDFPAEELDGMTMSELESHLQEIYEVQQAIKAEAREVSKIINKKSVDTEYLIKHQFDKLPEEKRKAVLQILRGDIIKKEESVKTGGQ